MGAGGVESRTGPAQRLLCGPPETPCAGCWGVQPEGAAGKGDALGLEINGWWGGGGWGSVGL